MNNLDEFLLISRELNKLQFTDKMNYHIVRYKFFYDNSARKHNCTYAKMTYIKFWEENEREKLIEILIKLNLDQLANSIKELHES